MTSKKNNELDLDAIMKDDYDLPLETGGDSLDFNKDLEMIIKEEGIGFGKYGGDPKSFGSSLKFDPKLSFPKYDKDTQDLLDQSDKLYKNNSNNAEDRNQILKKFLDEDLIDNQPIKIDANNEAMNMGSFAYNFRSN